MSDKTTVVIDCESRTVSIELDKTYAGVFPYETKSSELIAKLLMRHIKHLMSLHPEVLKVMHLEMLGKE